MAQVSLCFGFNFMMVCSALVCLGLFTAVTLQGTESLVKPLKRGLWKVRNRQKELG